MSSSIQLGNLAKLTKEDQWDFWLEDLTGVMFLNGLDDYFNSTVVEGDTDAQKAEFVKKHETVRAIIHSALSLDIRERMKHHGYDRTIHRGKDIINYVLKAVKLITGNMDRLNYSMWKDLRRSNFKSWVEFTIEVKRLYTKLKESGQEVTPKTACIHLFDKIRAYLPIWVEINETRYLLEPDFEKLLLELETRGRQLEYDGVSLANLCTNGDRNPKDYISNSKTRGAAEKQKKDEEINQNNSLPQGQDYRQQQKSDGRNHHDKDNQKFGTSQKQFCEPCDKWHSGDCWPLCTDCKVRHSPKWVCRKNRKPKTQHELPGSTPGIGYSPGNNATTSKSGTTQATENVFQYGMNAVSVTLAEVVEQGLTRDSWIFDTGASFHTCIDWNMMEDIVKGEP